MSHDTIPAPTVPLPRACPHQPPEEYAGMREAAPLARVSLLCGDPAWLVTRYEEARALLNDPRLSSDHTSPHYPEIGRRPGMPRQTPEQIREWVTFSEMDDPEHAQHRRLVVPAFSLRRVRAMRDGLQRSADHLIGRMLAEGPPADLADALALRFPPMMYSQFFAIPAEERADFEEHARLGVAGASANAGAYYMKVYDRLDRLLTERRAEPGDDLLSLAAAGPRTGTITHRKIVETVMMLVVAGNESTANMIALGVYTLLTHPAQLARLREDPSAMPGAVEELLRYLSIADTAKRWAKADIPVGDQVIRAGDAVLVSTLSANRDERFFPAAATLDVGRSAQHHLAFGYGIHQCLGHNLTRLALEVVFSTLLARVPTLRLAVPEDEIAVDGGVGMQRISALPVTWQGGS